MFGLVWLGFPRCFWISSLLNLVVEMKFFCGYLQWPSCPVSWWSFSLFSFGKKETPQSLCRFKSSIATLQFLSFGSWKPNSPLALLLTYWFFFWNCWTSKQCVHVSRWLFKMKKKSHFDAPLFKGLLSEATHQSTKPTEKRRSQPQKGTKKQTNNHSNSANYHKMLQNGPKSLNQVP